MLRHSEPPGYRRRQPPKRPKLAPFTDIIDRILEEDRTVHRKQHHTAKRIFERLRDEHGFTGKETIVKDYVRERWTHPGKVEAPYTVCIASASNLTGLVKSSVECRRTGL